MSSTGHLSRRAILEKSGLPFERMGDLDIRAVELAIREAWLHLVKNQSIHDIDLTEANEVTISERLVRIIDVIRRHTPPLIPAFSNNFETPQPDAALRNYRNDEIDYPDFVFRLKVNTKPGINGFYFGLFVEAKIIANGNQNVGTYVREGLKRFLDGEYAWAMPHAMMIGYKRFTTQTLPKPLDDHFNKPGNKAKYEVKSTASTLCIFTRVKPRAYITIHGRSTWNYVGTGNPPGDIEIIHLWLEV